MKNEVCDNLNTQKDRSNLLNRKERNSVFELLRIISMILIVSFHAKRLVDVEQLSIVNRSFFYFISSWGLIGVDLFVIISAWFLSDQKFRVSKLIALAFEVFTYVLLFTILRIVWNIYKTSSITSAIKEVLNYHAKAFLSPLWGGEYWFITAYIFMLIEAMADAAVREGLPRAAAYRFAAQTVRGSAQLVLASGRHPADLKDMVCSPAGTTIAAVKVLEEKGFRSAVMDAMEACKKRSEELH